MHFILTLGVPGTGPYGQINSLQSCIRDYKEHLRNIEMGAEKGTKKDIEEYQNGIKEKKAAIRKIREELKQKKQQEKE